MTRKNQKTGRGRAMRLLAIFSALVLLVLPGMPEAAQAKRVALVIGNDAYTSLPVLKKAVNDAEAVAATLETIGFKVFLGTDLTRRQMNRKLADFTANVAPGDQAFLFFAGHGVALGAGELSDPGRHAAARDRRRRSGP